MNEEILEVKIKKKEINLIIWIIPLISLIVGGWLVYKYYSSLGPLITIKFKNSGGLEPKRSVVKFRDVEVGKVENVKILKNSEGVLVYVRMHKDMKPFLNDTTKFWIVKPQIGLEQVRGLDALLSGPYIQMYAKPKDFTKEEFTGLSEPPIDSSILNGKIITLIADSTYGLSDKLPVYFKHMKVGTIRKVELTDNAKAKIIISINKKYSRFVNDSTKFWNVKKVDIALVKNYLQVSLPSLKELIFGGIVFDTPEKNKTLNKTVFKLYASKSDAFANRLGKIHKYKEFIVEFDKQNSLINSGEAVKFKGFDIGYVKEANSVYDVDKNRIITYAVLKIDTGAFMKKENEEIIKKLFEKGISVYVKQNIPLLQSASINIAFTHKAYKYELIDGKIKIKSIYKKEITIADKLGMFLDKLNSIKLNKTVDNLNSLLSETKPAINKALISVTKTSDSLRNLIDSNDKKLSAVLNNINAVMKNLNKTLNAYSENSLFYKKVSKTLYDVDKTMNNLNRVIIKIDKKPNSLIFGE